MQYVTLSEGVVNNRFKTVLLSSFHNEPLKRWQHDSFKLAIR
ncbi:hypothetical protein LCGC14_1439150, partial [marine sediment metagenome]